MADAAPAAPLRPAALLRARAGAAEVYEAYTPPPLACAYVRPRTSTRAVTANFANFRWSSRAKAVLLSKSLRQPDGLRAELDRTGSEAGRRPPHAIHSRDGPHTFQKRHPPRKPRSIVNRVNFARILARAHA